MSRLTPIVSLVLSGFLAHSTYAQATEGRVWSIRDTGQDRKFQIALDQIGTQAKGGGWKLEPIRKAANTGALVRVAKSRKQARPQTETALIMWEQTSQGASTSPRWVTRLVTVTLADPAMDPAPLAALVGAIIKQRPAYARQLVVLELPEGDPLASLNAAEILRNQPGVAAADVQLARNPVKKSIPNDPLFSFNAGREGYQWHLRNTGNNGGTTGMDARVTSVWNTWLGNGITIGIVDDGLQQTHPDLSPNILPSLAYDWVDDDNDPTPAPGDGHGTACAGVAAARGSNGIGGSGVAPRANIVGLRLLGDAIGDMEEAAAQSHRNDVIQIKSNSWGEADDGATISAPGPLLEAAFANALATGRANRGTIFTWAAGNGRHENDDAGFDGYASHNGVIAVTSVGDQGRFGAYAEHGSNILIAAPSDGQGQGITTTDLTGVDGYNDGTTVGNYDDNNHTNEFGGTSAACPLVSGVAALVLQSRPTLGWRDLQHILVRTARLTDTSSPHWLQNGAGFHFSKDYGAGVIDAQAAVNLAATWVNVGPLLTQTVASGPLNKLIPDDASDAGLSHNFSLPAAGALNVERARVTVSINHPNRGDLEISLKSPSGTSIILGRTRAADTNANLNYTFGTPHFWGEPSTGNWTLLVRDNLESDHGTLVNASITLSGTALGTATAPIVTGPANLRIRTGVGFNYQFAGSNQPTSYAATGLPSGVSLSPTGLLAGTVAAAGTTSISITATNAQGTGPTRSVSLIALANDASLANGIDATSLLTVSAGHTSNSPWARQTSVTQDGVDAVKSGVIGDNQISAIETRVTGPGTLRFLWKVSSEESYDKLRLLVNDQELYSISGLVNWTLDEIEVPAGQQTIRWAYTKDNSDFAGADAGYVDTVTFLPADSDGDGFTAKQEALFGTSDTLGSSFPRLTMVTGAGGLQNFTFPSLSGKTYQLQRSTELTTWTIVRTVTASAAQTATTDTPPPGSGPQVFYRIFAQ